MVKTVKHFRPYLYGNKFRLRTDHASLRWLCRQHKPFAQIASWLEIFSPFSYQLEHIAGKLRRNTHGLSRQNPCLDCTQCAAIEKCNKEPSRAKIEAELQQIREIQAKDPVAQAQATGEHPVANSLRLCRQTNH